MTALFTQVDRSLRLQNGDGSHHQRLDIQGLRMVAVITVFAFHLVGWPRGGFIGVDVFFVISGFLITGNLLRMAESRGNVSFTTFYWNRVRRILPAATAVLLVTYLVSLLVFQPFRSQQVGIDAFFAFIFMSNWWFASQATDYFAGGGAVSPVQHYWSLSIEEQFYFVWPALIFVIGLFVARRALTHDHQIRFAGAVMACVVAASLGWALYETSTAPAWAYFDTLSRVWELGVGALLATSAGALGRIPAKAKPFLSWGGLAVIAAGLLLISEDSIGFPAPWALLPVVGAALVIAAGVNGEPEYQRFLQNPISVYVGNISYSLYLVHWPVIVFIVAGSASVATYVVAVLLAFGLAIGSYHLIENPLRYGDVWKTAQAVRDIRRRRYRPKQSSKFAAIVALSLVTAGLTGYSFVRTASLHETAPPVFAADRASKSTQPAPSATPDAATTASGTTALGPAGAQLQTEIAKALTATTWPQLDPSMESVMGTEPGVPADFTGCGTVAVNPADPQMCTWGSPSAPTKVVLVGDSVARAYGWSFRDIALNSNGRIQFHLAAVGGCVFTDAEMLQPDDEVANACPALKDQVVDYINTTKPDIVILSNLHSTTKPLAAGGKMAPGEWGEALRRQIDKFRAGTKKVVLLSAPPSDKNVKICFVERNAVPADCISGVNPPWQAHAAEEQNMAPGAKAVWIDSQTWFCDGGFCPSFVETTPVKSDTYHMTHAYAAKIAPVIAEAFKAAGIF